MLHGETASKNAELTARNTFENKSIGLNLPVVNIKKEIAKKGINIVDLVILSQLSNSKSEVRRLIKNKGIRINNEIIKDEKIIISINYFNKDNMIKLSHGKKNHTVIKII